MKIKNPYIAIVAIFILAISIYSCRKDFMGDDVQVDPKVAWAKSYFRETLLPNEGNVVDAHNYVANMLQANLMTKKKENHKIPIWQKAMEGRTDQYEFVEIPLKYTTKVTPMIYRKNDGDNSEKIADEAVIKASFDRLIIFKKKNGDISQRIISFVPTRAYLERHNGDISHNRINKLDKDFDGVLTYRKWNGAFESALIVKNGKGVKRVILENRMKFKKAAFRVEDCDQYQLLEWFQDCEYEGDNPVLISCSEAYYEVIASFEICHDEDEPFDPCALPENFEICNATPSEGGSATDPQGNPEPDIQWGEADDTNVSMSNTETSDTTGTIVTGWYCYKAHSGSIHFKSYERVHYNIVRWSPGLNIVYKKYGIDHTDHISMASEGTITGQDISPLYVYHIDYTTSTLAKIKVVFKDRREYVQSGKTVIKYSPDISANNSWTKAQLSLIDD